MKPASSLKVVVSNRRQSESPASIAPTTLIVSTEPGLFAARFAQQLGQTVYLYDQGEVALQQLHQLVDRVQIFVADFRALPDRWTGQKFLKYIRDRHEFDHVKVYLMADQWQKPQEQWIVKCGAEGFIRRKPDSVASKVLVGAVQTGEEQRQVDTSSDVPTTSAGDPWMEEVNQVFKRFAGALGAKLLTMQALEAMESAGHGDRYFYVADLSSRLMNPGRRSEFLVALKQAGLTD